SSDGESAEPPSSNPADHPLNLYQYPELYDALKTPDPADVALVREIIQRYVGPGPYRMLDPACGPGNWLAPFADGKNRLVGNDFCEPMVQHVQETLGNRGCRAVHGDMYNLKLGNERFDVVLEASGVTSIVPDVPTLARFLDGLSRVLAKRGVVVLLANCAEPAPAELPALLWERENPLPDGSFARVRYELVEDCQYTTGHQVIRRTVHVVGSDRYPDELTETYSLRIWSEAELAELRGLLGKLRLEAVLDADTGAHTHPAGERYLVFRAAE
ncbi:MAG: class I SAM-dependent methyltransferase, partial [Planctomycetes bacterium]|nr:class I SAM-dependent methyltransferase [Planctomycetota bacterium]